MKAIVLSFDRHLPFVDHMIHTYQERWPSNPFRFRVPYQEYPRFLAEKYGEKIELLQARAAIKGTMEDLLADIGDEEWLYWCIDDKYLIQINERQANQVYNWIREVKDPTVCGVVFCRGRRLLEDENLISDSRLKERAGQVFIERRNYRQIWLHQFLRARVLKRLFQSFPDEPFRAIEMKYFMKERRTAPDQRLFVVKRSLAVFGESTSRGEITPNCVESFKKFGMEVPDGFSVHRHGMIWGQLPRRFLGIPIRWISRKK